MSLAGYKELLLKMERIELDAPVAAAFGTYDGMQDIMIEAKRLAPKDTTAMALSGYVEAPEVRQGSSTKIQAGFGGLSAEYVLRQHYDTTLNHPNGGEALFFQKALDAGRMMLKKKIQAAVAVFLRTGRAYPVAKRVPASPTEEVP